MRSPHFRRSDLCAIHADGAAFSVMVGAGETYVPAFVLAIGLGDVAAGLVATVPMVAGGLMQMISPWAVRHLRTHRGWVVSCALVQVASLVFMAAVACLPAVSGWWAFVAAAVYWGSGLATGPAWNAWVERLVPRPLRPRFFARRTRIGHVCLLAGLIGGGVWLRWSTTGISVSVAFATLFTVAALARLGSALMLARQSEPHDTIYLDERARPVADAWKAERAVGGRLVAYLLAMQVAVYLAGPYFTPYMLGPLQMGYLPYMLLLSSSFLGKILAVPWAGSLARRVGASRLLWLGSLGIVPLSALWLVSSQFWYLMALQLLGGLTWACYELAMLLLFFETIPRHRRVEVLTWYNLGNAVAMALGALLGGGLLHLAGGGASAFLVVFGISAGARLLALPLMPGGEYRRMARIPFALRTIAIRPAGGTIERPILPDVPNDGST